MSIGEDMLMLALEGEEEARELEPMVNGKIMCRLLIIVLSCSRSPNYSVT